jgi:hypothetical protein
LPSVTLRHSKLGSVGGGVEFFILKSPFASRAMRGRFIGELVCWIICRRRFRHLRAPALLAAEMDKSIGEEMMGRAQSGWFCAQTALSDCLERQILDFPQKFLIAR